MRIFLQFSASHGPAEKARLDYAFRLYCAVYGHQPLQRQEAKSADLWLSYSESDSPAPPAVVRLNPCYRARAPQESAPSPAPYSKNGEATVLVHQPKQSGGPDWLAEIFEWVSCADEYSVSERDGFGRIPFSRTFCGRHALDVQIPWAALAMQFLHREISRALPAAPLAPLPLPGGHLLVNTHDVDFVPLTRRASAHRLFKNATISLLERRLVRLAIRQALRAARLAGGGADPLDQILPLARKEAQSGLPATYFFIPDRRHAKDANYTLDSQLVRLMHAIENLGFEIGVHGSFTSLDQPEGLSREFDILRRHNFDPWGERQHWLRYTLDRLLPAVEGSGAHYDTSIGWSDRIGFRAAACFAFPPYCFSGERPARFLEIPLAIMDLGLLGARERNRGPLDSARELLAASRRHGWGGVSLLWHPTAYGEVQLPGAVDEAFWSLADARQQLGDVWLSGRQFVERVRSRYVAAGFSLPHQSSPESLPPVLAGAGARVEDL